MIFKQCPPPYTEQLYKNYLNRKSAISDDFGSFYSAPTNSRPQENIAVKYNIPNCGPSEAELTSNILRTKASASSRAPMQSNLNCDPTIVSHDNINTPQICTLESKQGVTMNNKFYGKGSNLMVIFY